MIPKRMKIICRLIAGILLLYISLQNPVYIYADATVGEETTGYNGGRGYSDPVVSFKMSTSNCEWIEEMNMEEMVPESIYEKLKELKTNWVKNTNKKQNEIEEQKEVREFVSENQKYLTILKSQYPEEFERFYWNILVCVKRNDIFQNTVYSKMLPVVTLCISILSMMLSVANFFPDNVGLKIALTVVSFIAGLISLFVFGLSIWSAMNTREFSYYEIMISILEDLRNR